MFGNFRGLLEQESTKPKSTGETLWRLARYFRPYGWAIVVVLVLMALNAWVQVIGPVLNGQAVDCYLTPAVVGSGQSLPHTISCLFAVPPDPPRADLLIGLQFVGAITGGLMFYLTSWAGNHVLRQLQVAVFDKMQQLSLGYYSRHESGELMSRITNDASTIQ